MAALANTFIPYGGYWSSPFCRWQGSLGSENSVALAARTATAFLRRKHIATDAFDSAVLGMTVMQKHSFYGVPWLTGMIGAEGIGGPTVSQACATSARALAVAAGDIEMGRNTRTLAVTCDRTSNGPHVYYPNPGGPGGMGNSENPVWDNFNRDPHAGKAMIETAENVASAASIGREAQDAIALMRYQQYERAMADERAFQLRYMQAVEVGRGKRAKTIDADEGVHSTTAEGLAKLRPGKDGGTVTFGSQTHPADGNAGMIVCTEGELGAFGDDGPRVQVLGFGEARVEPAFMPMAVVPAARAALAHAGVELGACKAIKTHNPFAVNDAYFCQQMELPPDALNDYGSPLIYGHPQGPTGMRAIIELIEELEIAGGGHGLFSGCAAGDTAMAVVVRVG
jgi:acetyl-CoA acetyltransferase